MPVRKREGSPFLWYSFTVGGRRFRGSTGKTSKREAEEVERDKYQLAKQVATTDTDWNLLTVLNVYWNEQASHKASADGIFLHLADLQRILGKDKRTSQLTNGDLMDYRAKRRGEKRRGKYPAANSINREFAYLRAAYEHCARIHHQPMPRIDWKALRAKEPPGRKRFLSVDEYERLMKVAPKSLREIILCAVSTGLRKENILALDWDQVKLDRRVIHARIKGNKEHTVRITPALMAALSAMPDKTGKVFGRTNFRRRWEGALTEAKIADFRFHDLRHTFASWARQSGADLADICEALDHSSLTMTMRYSHIKPDEHTTAFDRVSKMILAQSRAQSPKKRRKSAKNL